MTYKTLRRKSDGQWMTLKDVVPNVSEEPCFYSESVIDWHKRHFPDAVDWSLYELVEVVVIPVDEIPSDENVWKEINARIPDEYYAQETGKIINRYKSQILKP